MSIRFILLVSLCMVSAAPVLARGGGKGRTRVQSLPNGLSLILAPDDRAGGVDVTVWYPAGTSRETSGKTGLTHVVEQLMFRSVSQPGAPSYIARIEGLGGAPVPSPRRTIRASSKRCRPKRSKQCSRWRPIAWRRCTWTLPISITCAS